MKSDVSAVLCRTLFTSVSDHASFIPGFSEHSFSRNGLRVEEVPSDRRQQSGKDLLHPQKAAGGDQEWGRTHVPALGLPGGETW